MADFASRDPLSPGFWDERFAQGFTPWDRGGVPEQLRVFIAASAPLATLIPGCGTGYELAAFCGAGWDATAIDFAPVAVANAQAALGPWAARVVEADFFTYAPNGPLDLIYERAFLCAMPRLTWPQVAARWAALLAPGALLAGYFFFDDGGKGPPFGIDRVTLNGLLTPYFDCTEDVPVADSIPVFRGRERWMVWRRRQGPCVPHVG
ncbi:methyltransferase domain-containing protein [Massilia sp. S19_KUP03_FR1]|uniref:methyltransferase domain-containing protein n=1 Tax=Massilia sp. S19_KUP03_FR1 TaxID=3025503 RepID=UPI002FCDC618